MYESYFGFSGTPFNLNPDPSFYFESRGHGHALSYLKFGVYQGEGFVVVTGEIGAGKTTLVRTLLSGLDSKEIVAAQIVSTQLDAGDLLRSVALAFGIPPKNLSKAELIATIEAFLTELVLQKKRALLVVDEAQNLNLAAIEELRMLSNFQLGNHALLQSFLIGQPELRALLTSKPMEQLRQRVIASCHLGPMDRKETEAYVRHRLGRVGWTDRPTFDAGAFDQIFEWTGGVPRRVNLLCNRLLLATFLQSGIAIDGPAVRAVAQEVLAEFGPSQADEPPLEVTAAAASDANAPTLPGIEALPAFRADDRGRPLLFAAASRSDDIKLGALMRALKPRKGLPPMVLLRMGDEALFAFDDAYFSDIGLQEPVRPLAVEGPSAPARIAQAIQRFEATVDELEPVAVVVAGAGDAVLAAALVCHKKGIRLVHADAGRRVGRDGAEVNAVLIEQLADLFYSADKTAYDTLVRAGVPKARVLMSGSLMADSARLCAQTARRPAEILGHVQALQTWFDDRRGFGLVAASRGVDTAPADELAEQLSLVRQVSQDMPLIWPIGAASRARLDALGLRNLIEDAHIALVDPIAYPDMVGLIGAAAMVLTDSPHVQACAAALRVPCLRMDQDQDSAALSRDSNGKGSNGRSVLTLPDVKKVGTGSFKTVAPPKELDGHAAERIAEHLTEWFLSTALVAQLVRS